ncbi:MAG: hypothetical protein WCG83_06000 [Candidatus Peregrinibacteria bacterium]
MEIFSALKYGFQEWKSKFHSGTTRIAFVGEQSTVKIASPVSLIRTMRGSLRKLFAGGDISHVLNTLFKDENWAGSLAYSLRGLSANTMEAKYSPLMRNLVAPTHSLFGGVWAVQPTTQDLPDFQHGEGQWTVICEAVGNGDVRSGSQLIKSAHINHTIVNPDNFGILNDTIVFRDFGDKAVIQFLLEHGSLIREALQKLFQGLSSVSQSPITKIPNPFARPFLR